MELFRSTKVSNPDFEKTEILIRGKKVSLRTFILSDISDQFISWLNDPQVVKYSNQRFYTHSYETCFQYLQSFAKPPNLYLAIVDNINSKVYGSITAYRQIHHDTADIGILLGDRTVWGQGIGTECYVLLINYMFNTYNIRKITAGTLRTNVAMLNIFKKIGMELEAVKKKHEIVDGIAVDILYFAIYSNQNENYE